MGKMFGYILTIFALDIALFVTLGRGTMSVIYYAISNIQTISWFNLLLAGTGTFFGLIAFCIAALSTLKEVRIFGSGITLSENAGFAYMTTFLFGYGMGTLIGLFQAIAGLDNFCMGSGAPPCQGSNLIAMIIAGPIILGWAWSCLEFSRGRD